MATIRKRNGKYEAQVRRTGQPHVSRSFRERRDAQQWARQMEIAADRHDLPATADRKALGITLGALIQRYRDTVTVHKRGGAVERVVLNAFALHPICRKTLASLRTSDFAAYRDERLKTVKPTTVKRQLGPIHNLFEVAKTEWGIPLKENPLDKLKLDAPDQRRERRLKSGELDKLIAAARKSRNPLIAPIILFAVQTGMRRGEILSVRRNHFDAVNHCLLIPETKNGRARTIPLTDAAVSVLQGVSGNGKGTGTELVFPISANCLRLAFERVRRRAGIADVHLHDMRHEFCSRAFEAGLTAPEVASISGHRSLSQLSRYAHAGERRVIAAKLAASAAPEPTMTGDKQSLRLPSHL